MFGFDLSDEAIRAFEKLPVILESYKNTKTKIEVKAEKNRHNFCKYHNNQQLKKR